MTETGVNLRPGRVGLLAGLGVALGIVIILLGMERPPICPCGTVRLWQGVVESPENSQQISDWYSFSHMIHGFLFYGVAHLAWRKAGLRAVSPQWALACAVLLEGAWEILENSPIIIDRYRAVTVSFGYSGDSVLNSFADMGFMALGFVFASRAPALATVAIAIVFELFTLFMIRDNLTLNVLMLVSPVEAVRQWQSGH
ncbi:MAG: hypothetical protein B7Y36_01775 [Novosphingobium sp. 28-62-57]|uniref:DUF2585 domain-containing protein n=1 Tax=unclassified Novosphingobium TaxID=2644732 RepID=UPI000BC3FB20|nr:MULTISPECIES: DUF2585 domain-containing protein [unclassified Novosphingobium]OYW49750.1 MAG: hypothetical protein B7Z34_08835 [Novosphingobium sp. 12-62-10]OYZ22192.1 MAG: hypothetical protein B7Y31_14675 [Novosphingobium sp. 16-62-11]OZA31818.1 MAG: hypothetical protein B7X92_13355 [Novosphingobium sp. 17-62-9]OYZ12295.1 MAG: hypothetical protein B7Y36_01775 [Novosphingobium sp. 28-62-57]HQS71231.1 DUF2585 domain-containing protein [Novosphingobium sp.]